MAIPEPTFHSADAVRELNAANPRWWPRYEAVYGELLVTPAPSGPHQFVVARLHTALAQYLEREPVGVALMAPADISWGRRDVTVQPDVFVLPMDQARTLHTEKRWLVVRQLLLAAEVLSPGSVRSDRFVKRPLYQRMGVPLYWVLDPDRGTAEAWTPELQLPEVLRERLTWHPDGASEPFAVDLAALFAPP